MRAPRRLLRALMDPSFSVDEVPVSSIRGIEAYSARRRFPSNSRQCSRRAVRDCDVWTQSGPVHPDRLARRRAVPSPSSRRGRADAND
jgi:hypothetical protein